MIKPELLAPAGDMEKLKTAISYGADAVYLGGPGFGLRAAAGNFSLAGISEGTALAHSKDVKVYVTVNIFAGNDDIDKAPPYFKALRDIGVDALIITDLGLFSLARELVPEIPLHISTQANTTNWRSCQGWHDLGAERIVLAREVSLQGIKEIKKETKVEIETFIHGAMCMAYSGRCWLSHYFTGRSGNRGECAQPCRWKYHLVEELRPGEYIPVEENDQGTQILSPADLCMIEHVPQLIDAGLDSLKIEGRMKSVHYVATIVKAYREAIDTCYESLESYNGKKSYWLEEIKKASNRPLNTGFYFGQPEDSKEEKINVPYKFVGIARNYDRQKKLVTIEQRNRFFKDDLLEIVPPKGDNFTYRVKKIINSSGEEMDSAPHPQQEIYLPIPKEVEPWSLIRKIEE